MVNGSVNKWIFKRRRCVITTHVSHVLKIVTSAIEITVSLDRAWEILSRNNLWGVAHVDLLVVRLTQGIVL